MKIETEQNQTHKTEQVMIHRIEKFTATPKLSAPLITPMYSSPWLALYLHLKASFNQSSAS
jgi:hypothetical protein